MEMRQVVTGTLAWAGLVVVVAVPATEALVSHLTQPHAGPSIETIAPIAAPAAPPQSASVSATPQVLPPARSKPVVATLRPDPKPAVQPTPIVATTTAAPAVKPVSVEKPLSRFSPVRLETSNADDRIAPPVDSRARELPAKVADLPAAPESVVSPIAPATKLASSVVDKPVVGASAPAADLPPVDPPVASKATIDPASARPPEVQVATTGAENAASASPDATERAVVVPPAAPPLPMPVSARPKEAPAKLVTADDLKGWKSGSLADYLKQRGLVDSGDTSPGNSN